MLPLDIDETEFDRAMNDSGRFWLGQVVTSHIIGDIQIIEYEQKQDRTKRGFSVYINKGRTGYTADTLDLAILTALGIKYDGRNSQFALYAARMLGIADEN